METGQSGIAGAPRLVLLADAFRAAWSSIQDLPAPLGTREFGHAVVDNRSSWVRRGSVGGIEVFVKTYDYPTLGDRVRGCLRTTWLAPGRARREAAALSTLCRFGLPGPMPLAVLEWRRRGWLRRSVLVTEAWDGVDLERLALSPDPEVRRALGAAARAFAQVLHGHGFVDGNLDPRNLLARHRADGSIEICKIDSPRFRLIRNRRRRERASRADLERLESGLRDLGLDS